MVMYNTEAGPKLSEVLGSPHRCMLLPTHSRGMGTGQGCTMAHAEHLA